LIIFASYYACKDLATFRKVAKSGYPTLLIAFSGKAPYLMLRFCSKSLPLNYHEKSPFAALIADRRASAARKGTRLLGMHQNRSGT